MKLFVALLSLATLQAQVSISGTFKYPDTTSVTGKVSIRLTRPTITNFCASAQVLTFKPVTASINAGTMAEISLYASPCMVPQVTPVVHPGNAAGAGATTNISGTDLQGTITLHIPISGMPMFGNVANVIFTGGPYAPSPTCYITPNFAWTYVASRSGIAFSFSQQLLPVGTYTISYYCAVIPYTIAVTDNKNKPLYNGLWVVPNQGSADVSVLGAK